MTVGEALSGSVSFSVSPRQTEVTAVTRGLDTDAEFTVEVAQSKEFNLSKADLIRLAVTTPNISEGGVSISFSDRQYLVGIANKIYSSYGEDQIVVQEPTVKYIDW